MTNLPYPSITGTNPQEQIQQLRSYLYQLVDMLNYTLAQLDKKEEKK